MTPAPQPTRAAPPGHATSGGTAPASSAAATGGRGARSEPKASETHQDASAQASRDRPKADAPAPAPGDRPRPAGPRLLNAGYGNLIVASRIVAIVAPGASPMRRLRREAAERGKLVDATEGRRTRSILVLDSDHVVLSAINPETLAVRLGGDGPEE